MLLERLPQLRVAVNSRCGRSCFFCRPSGEAISTPPHRDIDPDTLVILARAFVLFGLREIKLTGGDPALWEPLAAIVPRLKKEAGMEHIEIISRHPQIGELASALALGGVDVINVSVDSLRPELHREITGVDDLPDVLYALEKCVDTGVSVKVNTVVLAGVNDAELEDIISYCEVRGVAILKFLDVIQDMGEGVESYGRRLRHLRRRTLPELYRPLGDLAEELRQRAVKVRQLQQGGLGHPMTSFRLSSGLDVVLKDHSAGAWYGSVCDSCHLYPCHDALMALRVTADLRLQFCLLRENVAVDLKPHLNGGFDTLARILGDALAVYDTADFHAPSVAQRRSSARELRVLGG